LRGGEGSCVCLRVLYSPQLNYRLRNTLPIVTY
jgi:hypothetical protein